MVVTNVDSDISAMDLGTLFIAGEVLASRELRQSIIDGLVLAGAGTTNLSRTPVV